MTKKNKSLNKYEQLREQVVNYFDQVFQTYLKDPKNYVFHEIFFFDDIYIQNHIVGAHRAAIHTALNDPHSYLQVNYYSVILFHHFSNCFVFFTVFLLRNIKRVGHKINDARFEYSLQITFRMWENDQSL